MRIIVLGGTRFIGRAIVEELVAGGHEVTVVHRGVSEPEDLPDVRHVHVARAEMSSEAAALRAAQPDAVIDCLAMTRDGARTALHALPDTHLVVLSSQDVYRAFSSLEKGAASDGVPIDETSPLRDDIYPHRGRIPGYDDYSKIEVEQEYAARGGAALRLPAVYGERDGQRREEFILRRVRAGRTRVPIGPGALLWSRAYVRDVARGARAAAVDTTTAGEVFNLAEEHTWSARQWAAHIIDAAGSSAELVQVADGVLPPDMELTSSEVAQHLLISSARARARLGYTDTDAMTALRASVRWHLEHPPDEDGDFTADDAALRTVTNLTDTGASRP